MPHKQARRLTPPRRKSTLSGRKLRETIMNLLGKVLLSIVTAAPLVVGPVGMAAASCAKMIPQCEIAEQKPTAKVGEPAPNFTLDAVVGKEFKRVSLADYRGKW